MNQMVYDAERLGGRHYVGTMDRSRGCVFCIESKRFDERRQTHGGNFCVILRSDNGRKDDYFVIPYQILAPILADGSTMRLVEDGVLRGWIGTIADNTTLSIEGGRFDVQIGSYYRKTDLLLWLIRGNDLFSFTQYRADEVACGWAPYKPPALLDAKELKRLQDVERRISVHPYTARPGQAEFRESLRQRYGDRCMITGCPLLEIVEAAHIVPYRMTSDHHPANGLLLRADVHALFDLHLLGIDPESLVVSVHPAARRAGYADLDGARLRVPSDLRPSRDALTIRRIWFQERIDAHDNFARCYAVDSRNEVAHRRA
jgi:hypothetical protein